MIEMEKLPYSHSALAPHISKETMHYHYNKHYKAYVDNLNKLIKDTEFAHMELEEIIGKSKTGPIFNNAAQAWNHVFYFNSMVGDKKMLDEESKLGKMIKAEFKTIEAFEKEFTEKAKKLFGSGWVWLTHNNGKVSIEATHNANGPKNSPLLVCDKWEHAFYLDYQNEVPEYVKNFFKVVNWKFAEGNLK